MPFPFFNAHHSPVGAFATFTFGMKGPKGGLGHELAGPANEPIYIGVETIDGGHYQALPFYGEAHTSAENFDVEGLGDMQFTTAVKPFADEDIVRNFGCAVDEWCAGDLSFRVYSPPQIVPDPKGEDARHVLTPSLIVELSVDNRKGQHDRKAFFGYAGSDRTVGMRILDEPGMVGIGQGTSIAIATEDEGVYAGLGWQPEAILNPRLNENLGFMLGSIGLLVGVVPAGKIRTFTFAVAFFKEGTATTGIETRYLYRRWFNRIEEVLQASFENAESLISEAHGFDDALANQLQGSRRLMAAHAIRSYYGSTQLLEDRLGRPLWVVHEGEYRMMNTFDLTVDQAFFELVMHPWTVRNVLDQFVERYSYNDGVRFPGDSEIHPGGLAFTHDMGVSNAFAPATRSGYEQAGLTGCFSYMSSEELTNFVLAAGLYISHTQDNDWAQSRLETLLACLQSLENRDNPRSDHRNGVMGLDANRCAGGSEITTYDSLDTSLGQARNNLYLAVKGWATYLVLEHLFRQLGDESAANRSLLQAERAAQTIKGAQDEDGMLPAIMGEGVESRIIPAIEALVYPKVIGIEIKDSELVNVLKKHFETILVPGICLFENGGWRLSSTSKNSWLSKIYLCQYVAEQMLDQEEDNRADDVHWSWLMDDDNAYFAWSDQMLQGKAVGSRYYPRGVTSVLWMAKGDRPLRQIEEHLAGNRVKCESLP